APARLEDLELPSSRLPPGAHAALADVCGEEALRVDRDARVAHAAGRGYADLVRLRAGDVSGAPDGVLIPESADRISAVLAVCAEHEVAVVPFGGGTSVVGGVEPLRDGHEAVLTLDLSCLDLVVDIDEVSLTATLEAGLMGPAAEEALSSAGLTLGHFPQSFEYSTVGGWVATRSAGQASTGYGRINELVEGVHLCAPAGELVLEALPATAAGPSLLELVVGSEGVLGVITQATLRVRPVPEERIYEGWAFRSFAEGAEALRAIEQRGASPDVVRLSDEEEARLALAMTGESTADRLGRAYLRARRREGGCLGIVGYEGTADDVARRRKRTGSLLRAAGGVALGRRPGRGWARGRFAGPYLRDVLMGRGVMVETLETATRWSRLAELRKAVQDALHTSLSARGTPPLVTCHISHVYPSGASLYFTSLARQEQDAELEQWSAAKSAASDAIVALGATITHHHAVGRDHLPWMYDEVGELGVELLRAAKERLDPSGIMNPGKLIPRASA
ncbi:MAG: FAD-binding oxidoreductase, partial [Actinomycetota bacterium]|nr:FAD-binding oxidoreductase [Actinomycetota bacterium]